MLSAISLFALVGTALAQANAANESQLAYVTAQYEASGFNTALENSQAFGIPLDAQALLQVQYGETALENGQSLTAEQTSELPTISVVPGEEFAGNFNGSATFTLMLADASAVGGPDPEGDFRHFLANSVTLQEGAVNLESGTVITNYAGPGPLENSGEHRYAWLLFQQPEGFTAPEGLNAPETGPSHWQVSEYVSQSNLGPLVAASFFTVAAPGTASFSAGATSSVSMPAESSAAAATSNSASARPSASESAAPDSAAFPLPISIIACSVSAVFALAVAA